MRAGLELWARDTGRELVVLDDESSAEVAASVHEQLIELGCEPVLGPYGSDTTRAVARARGGRIVWNHGAAADDVQRLPGVVSVPSPASRYLVALARAAIGLGAPASPSSPRAAPSRALPARGSSGKRPASAWSLSPIPATPTACCSAGRSNGRPRASASWSGAECSSAASLPVSPGLRTPGPRGLLAPVQWHPDLGGPASLEDYVAAQAYAAALIAERCLAIDHDDPLTAARSLSTETFFGPFELDETGLQTGHQLRVVRWRGRRQELVL